MNSDKQYEPRSAVSRDKDFSLGMCLVEHLHRDPSLTHPTAWTWVHGGERKHSQTKTYGDRGQNSGHLKEGHIWPEDDTREPSRVLKIFYVLALVMITQMYIVKKKPQMESLLLSHTTT